MQGRRARPWVRICGCSGASPEDGKRRLDRAEARVDQIREGGGEFLSFNLDALSQEGRETVLDELTKKLGTTGRIRTLMHSIAFGNLRLIAPLTDEFGSEAERDRQSLADKLGVGVDDLTYELDFITSTTFGCPWFSLLGTCSTFNPTALNIDAVPSVATIWYPFSASCFIRGRA